ASRVGLPWALTPDGASVVYASGGLFVAPVDGSAPPRSIGAERDALAYDFALDPRGGRVVYRAGPAALYAGLYCAALDGGSAPLELVGPNARGEVRRYALAPDGRSVVFTSAHADGGATRLYRVALDGGAVAGTTVEGVAVELDPALTEVSDFA